MRCQTSCAIPTALSTPLSRPGAQTALPSPGNLIVSRSGSIKRGPTLRALLRLSNAPGCVARRRDQGLRRRSMSRLRMASVTLSCNLGSHWRRCSGTGVGYRHRRS
jgi:hypothetical protein